MLWRALPAENYRGTSEDWPAFIDTYMVDQKVTDLILLGDRRPMHIAAADLARKRGVRVVVTELGYLRPDWITLERNGMSSFSHFPVCPDAILAIADLVPPADLKPQYQNDFFRLALWDVAYNLSNVFLWPLHPHYRWHAIYHPVAEYAGWVWRLARKWHLERDASDKLHRLLASGAEFYIFPLQLETDYQLRAHSTFEGQVQAIRLVIESFARCAPAASAAGQKQADPSTRSPAPKLLFKVHPLDNGLVNWRKLIGKISTSYGVGDRVVVIDGGDLGDLLRRCRGVVTINSTVGTAAMAAGRPIIALGSAIYVVDGLSFQGPIDAFWTTAKEPDKRLFDAFVRALAGTIQIRGGYYDSRALDAAVRGAVDRLEGLLVNEPGAFVDPPPRLTTELARRS
ncbi:MAG: capsule biosynthesis protein [Hyphomicrobium sp.]